MKKISQIIFLFLLILTPAVSGAEQLVPCTGTDCNYCHIVEIVNRIVQWVIMISTLIVVMVLAVAGWRLITSGGDSSAYEGAKKLFYNAVIGVVILLAAWTMIDTMVKILMKDEYQPIAFGPWNGLECGGMTNKRSEPLEPLVGVYIEYSTDPNDRTTDGEGFTGSNFDVTACTTDLETCKTSCEGGAPGAVIRTGTALGYTNEMAGFNYCVVPPVQQQPRPGAPVAGCAVGSCVAIPAPCSASGCTVSSSIAGALGSMHNQAGVAGARVTEGFPPSRQHKAACHGNGTCVDYSKAGGMTASEVQSVIRAAEANGLRPVYEVKTNSQRDELVRGGVSPGNILVLGDWISAPHFSIYGQ